MVGLMFLVGCSTSDANTSSNQQQNQPTTQPNHNQQPAGDDEILHPPALPEE